MDLTARPPDDGTQGRLGRIAEVLRAIVREARAEKLTFMAGSIAYHAFVSLLPLLVLLLGVFSSLGIPLRAGIESVTEAMLTPQASRPLIEQATSSDRTAGLSVVGAVVLLWGTLRIFRGLDTAFSDIYESEAENTLLDQFGDGLLVFGSFAAAIVAASYVETRFPVYGSGAGAVLARQGLLILGLSLTFLPMYYVFPDADVTVREVVPGVVLASVGLAAFTALFQFYVELSGRGAETNLVANIVLLLTWLYFSGLVILLGVAVNAVLSNRSRDVSIDPVIGGVPRGRRQEVATRRELVAELEALADRLNGDPESVVAMVDGEELSLHPPESITLNADATSDVLGTGDVTLTLRWAPREE
jgi:membrane protein